MSKDYGQIMKSGRERAEYGCIVTFENDTGGHLTLHREGPPLAALRHACAIALARDETFRIVSYSTPETVYRDVVRRQDSPGAKSPTSVELAMASQAGVRDCVHPRLIGMSQGRTKASSWKVRENKHGRRA